jgi:hypothetical protein
VEGVVAPRYSWVAMVVQVLVSAVPAHPLAAAVGLEPELQVPGAKMPEGGAEEHLLREPSGEAKGVPDLGAEAEGELLLLTALVAVHCVGP